MSSRLLNKDLVIASLVRAFFKYFTLGILENAIGKDKTYEPRDIKQQMLEYYEKISEVFNSEMFYALARINFKENEWEKLLCDFVTPETTTMDLVRFACRTDSLYSCMVEEYKYNFGQLLTGIIPEAREDGSYTKCDDCGTIDYEIASDAINRIASNAYSEGKKISENNVSTK